MKLIKPKVEIINDDESLDILKQIEVAGRTCYKSEDKITDDSAERFVKMLISSGHGAMLEHGTVYLDVPYDYYNESLEARDISDFYAWNPYSYYFEPIEMDEGSPFHEQHYYITTNYRVLVDNDRLSDLKYACKFTSMHERRVSVRFTMDRIGSQSFTRHRVFSFAQESTRYCNYSKDKFGGEITFIIPTWSSLKEGNYRYISEEGALGKDFYWNPTIPYDTLNLHDQAIAESFAHAEITYMELLHKWDTKISDKRFKTGYKGNPLTPQQARQVLPNALKTELVMTGTIEQWKGFFELRCALNAHPDARYLALQLQDEFLKRKYLNENEMIYK